MSPEPLRKRQFERLASVRARITLVAAGAVAIVLVAVGFALLRAEELTATANLDEILSDEAEAIAGAIADGDEVPPLYDDDRVMLARDPDGEVIAFLGAASDLFTLELRAQDDRGTTLTLDGEPHRMVAERYATESGVGVVLIGEPLDEVADNVDQLERTLGWLIPLTLVVLTIIIWWLVGLTLRPIDRMRRSVEEVGIRELDRRLEVPPGDDEVTRLALTLNDMLRRLESAIRRQQRFVADASHELRTPLARLRAEIEADAADPAGADAAASRQSHLEELTHLQGMVDDMLLLARADLDRTTAWKEPVDLDDIVLDEIHTQRAHTTVSIDASLVSGAQIRGSATELRRVVRNLLENALRHSEHTVAVHLTEVGDITRLIVDDDGPGIPDEWRTEVFERFRTIRNAARSTTPGSGLGLAIVAEVVDRHGGRVGIEDSPLGGARFVVELPLDGSS